jgi:hypothetical protein
MSEQSQDERKEQGTGVDWPALQIAVDEIVAALALVRGNSITAISQAYVSAADRSLPETLRRWTETIPPCFPT